MDSNVGCLCVCVYFWLVKFGILCQGHDQREVLVFLWLGSFFWVQPNLFQSVSLNPIILTRSPIIMYKFTLSIVRLRPKSKLETIPLFTLGLDWPQWFSIGPNSKSSNQIVWTPKSTIPLFCTVVNFVNFQTTRPYFILYRMTSLTHYRLVFGNP